MLNNKHRLYSLENYEDEDQKDYAERYEAYIRRKKKLDKTKNKFYNEDYDEEDY